MVHLLLRSRAIHSLDSELTSLKPSGKALHRHDAAPSSRNLIALGSNNAGLGAKVHAG
jgi:hypothetical protein